MIKQVVFPLDFLSRFLVKFYGSMNRNTTYCRLLSLLSPFSSLMLTAHWSTWCPSWATWSTVFTTHCCWRSGLWPTATRLYWEAAGRTSTGWATRSLLSPDCWGGDWRRARPRTAGQRVGRPCSRVIPCTGCFVPFFTFVCTPIQNIKDLLKSGTYLHKQTLIT